ncbi:MAG: OST-HTH/LOTUS domain-containing protein, partial [Candidatus Krumholzibacteria bacterium]|nr:OST-HTH/LOTUS domain-containing protein [Candidatus Krumholzibacteria bacterium]
DEFIFYDDLVRKREKRKRPAKPPKTMKKGTTKPTTKKKSDEERKQKALDLVVETIDMLIEERGEEEKLWGSMVKQAIRRRKPGFNESYYGFRAFSQLLEAAEKQGLVELELDERSGGYVVRAVYPEE